MDETEEDDDNIDINKPAFIGSDREKFNFNNFDMPLNFLSNIYNGKISLKEAGFKQKDLEKNRGATILLYTKKEKRKRRNR